MSKKLEQEILFKNNYQMKLSNGDVREGQIRLKRRGLRFYVEKSCLVGAHVLHVDIFDEVEEAYNAFLEASEKYAELLVYKYLRMK